MYGNTMTFEGTLGSDPELKFSTAGKAWAKFNVAVGSRKKDGDAWKDGPTTWITVKVFGQVAENAAESFQKGDRVIVSGKFETEEWTTQSGEERKTLVVIPDLLGPSVRFKPASTERTTRRATADGPDDLDVEPF